MCDSGEIMAGQMHDQITGGLHERHQCYERIAELESQNKELIEENKRLKLIIENGGIS